MAENDGWGRPGTTGDDDSTREFRPAPGPGNPYPQWGQAAGGQPDWGTPPAQPDQTGQRRGRGAGPVLLVLVPVLIIVFVAALLIWKWDDLFGSDGDSGAAGPTITSQAPPPTGEPSDGPSTTEAPPETGAARPDRPDLPAGAEPVNAAARANEPTGDFNSVYKSPPAGDNYTSDEFAEAVRDAFVEAYLDNRETDQTLDVRSPVTGDSYRMTCTDEGSYVHCTGGNNANVYIA
ncbi:hypothetical protein [Corynebacterium sp.]|jgi:hypothetical protein|uniref:hypothetical protein n=1 Tax=Corynebacterium sp. TaxID=1720 RepID=UPI0025C3484F|nr:hypothetical protein [Corynebacterium sp.]